MAETPFKPVIRTPPGYRHPDHVVVIPKPSPIRLRTERHHRRGCLFHCCCIFWIIFLVTIFAVAVAAVLIFFVYRPKPPIFRLQSFQISDLNITEAQNVAYLNADTAIRAEVRNPNSKMRFNFGETTVEISVEEGVVGLGSTTIPPLTVKEKQLTVLKAETSVIGEGVADEVKEKFERKEVVPRVEVRTSIGVNLQGWRMGNMEVNALCGGVSWSDIQDGIEPKCSYNFLVW